MPPSRRKPRDDRRPARSRFVAAPPTWALAIVLAAAPLSAQEEPAAREEPAAQEAEAALTVFFDCRGGRGSRGVCDFDFYRREIPFVNYTRDREDARVHVLLTSEQTGSGGQRYTLDFIGRESFEGVDDRLTVTTRANLAEEQQLTQIAATMKLGLVRYVARTEQATDLEILYERAEAQAQAVATPEDDPWNFWTFRIRADANLDVSERTESYRLSTGFSASRITEGLKLEFSVGGSYNENSFDTSDTTTVTSIRRRYDFEGLNVWSLSEHWSLGISYEGEHSTFDNLDLSFELAPALEYNIFPYSESTRRQFNILYTAGLHYNDYREETVFLETAEALPRHAIRASLSVRQPWGGTFGFLQFSQFLHDLSK
ncbi:MAG: hypothetical protein R3266_13755, partial [Gemmatimonadota bacterium]|nr:hypothetical protein [Gemmatimonadota bacterium]